MEKKRLDRRVQRTRQLLQSALLELILQKGYDEVTVQEITDRANLGRATFYLHYRDKQDLLVDCMETIVGTFITQFDRFTPDQWASVDAVPLRDIFEFAYQKADLYRVIISGQGGVEVSRRLHALIAANIGRVIKNQIAQNGFTPIVPVDFLSNYYAGSLLSLIYWWLEMGSPYSPEEITLMFHKVCLNGVRSVLGFGADDTRST